MLESLAKCAVLGSRGLRIKTEALEPIKALENQLRDYAQGEVVRAIMEAVAFALQNHIDELSQQLDTPFTEVRCAGGGARSNLWLQIKADVLGLPVSATDCAEPTSLGAAILAESALSRAEVPDIAMEWVRMKPAKIPNDNNHQLYQSIRSEWN